MFQSEDQFENNVHVLPVKTHKKFENKRDMASLKVEVGHTLGFHSGGNDHPYCPTCRKGK
jgi:hypothetical protein